MKISRKLTLAFVGTGLLAASVVGTVTFNSTGQIRSASEARLANIASNTMETIERNLFERYGDVQAFGYNTVVRDCAHWYKPGEDNPIVATMNNYVACYGLYSLTVLVDTEGKVIAVNTRDVKGQPVDTSFLYAKNFKNASWFRDCMGGNFLSSGALTGTVVEDFHEDADVARVYNERGLTVGFSAPVRDDAGKVIAVWKNFAQWSLVEAIVASSYEKLKAEQLGQVSLCLINSAGTVLLECDPTTFGKTINDDPSVVGRVNLAQTGEPVVATARESTPGASGVVRGADSRRGAECAAGFARSEGALGYPGLGWTLIARAPDSTLHAAANTVEAYTLFAVFGVAGLMIVPAVFFARTLVQPIRQIIDSIRDVAEGEGDLSRKVDESRADEVGELGHWFNVFTGKLRAILVDVAGATREVAGAATQIAASAEEMAAGLARQEQQASQVSSAVEEMSASVREVSAKARTAAEAAAESQSDSRSGGEIVQRTVAEMSAIAQDVTVSSCTVSSLGAKANEIGRIIKVINDIADQTNLLALNAAIEAARAGEHGRGFAVVADEVRKLAERTTRATEEVSTSIGEIQAETVQAVRQIEAGAGRVSKGVDLAHSAGQALGRITQSGEGLSAMVQSIAAAAEQQSGAAGEIAGSLERINAVSRESAEGASQSAQAATLLSRQAERLQSLVGRFKL
ncbi:MAG: methyl-accepting chemotaxis protein [Phycisphaerales bacterium]